VLVNDKKYACETCIKGHRSSACKHTTRPLYEIKKKGRPVTQCEHCRELRKRKQVHVKCICMSLPKDDIPPTSSSSNTNTSSANKKGEPRTLSAAFPDGLPASLEASVAVPDGSSSDTDRSGTCLRSAVVLVTDAVLETPASVR
ncbi:copper-fist-domain-containing protein, partial [Cylindrobasidium torrendii FP15055 ss-10]